MKNYKVIATREFKDSNEIDEKTGLKVERKVNDEFYCTKERYEYLKANNAVKLVEIEEVVIEEEIIEDVIDDVIESEEVDEIIDNVVDEVVEEIIDKKKKKNKK